MKGNRYMYSGQVFTFNGWVEVDGQIRILTDNDPVTFNKSELPDKISQLHLVGAVKRTGQNRLDPVEDVLMNMIDKLQDDPEFVGQAKEINSSVSNLINIQKLRLQMMKEARKNDG